MQRLNDAFASGDADFLINHIAEDVQWNLVGEAVLRGKSDVINILEPMRGVVSTEYETKQIITHGNKAVVEGTMKMPKENGGEKLYSFCDIYTFDHSNNSTVSELTAYLIELRSHEKEE
ncbi:nuclear transport factor 2 family protein [Bacillaceae bacterium SIJ1]|uniref:nuclear transport factor 2 family protein n=1 Tax=Litoribacterium kuwaitense TaxID=1398745 RepID=UPI0013EDCB3C|nr:nuclear transport factor 2 family protein [Litoribacterium kuwaitense]NGP46879.1 nuclear transport factor 2 family protein [Litoribacterium kuwaitense]